MKKVLAALAILGFIGGLAYAQSITLPIEPNTNQSLDVIQVIPNGQPSVQSQYATPAQITSASVFTKAAPTTAASNGYVFYFTNNQHDMLFEATATMLYLYIYLAATPQNGAQECFFSTQTVTTAYPTALTGQTLNNAITAMTANTRYCYTYSSSNTTWDRSM